MERPTTSPLGARVPYLLAVAAAPFGMLAVQAVTGHASLPGLWSTIAISVVAVLLFRLLSGVSPFTGRRLQFGGAAQLRFWQAPVLWVAVVVGATAVAFWWFVA